jgi:CRISPR-associated helicase Cas3/CRISPR-associated endonuclease Cas3-HD
MHDAGKTRKEWQDYIRKRTSSGVPHAYAGAMLFAALFDDLLEIWQLTGRDKRHLCGLCVNLAVIIYGHHGNIEDINGDVPPWNGVFAPSTVLDVDIAGLFELVAAYFPEVTARLKFYEETPRALVEKVSSIAVRWHRWASAMIARVEELLKSGNPYAIAARLCIHLETSRLITADRQHAGGLAPDDKCVLSVLQAVSGQDRIQQYCAGRKAEMTGLADQSILEVRNKWRKTTVKNFLSDRMERIFILELPTGYGKTITASSVALKAVELGLSRRIIYVAPYLSILSQAAMEISAATGLKVITHHHLSFLQRLVEQEVIEDLLMETWQAPFIATTFNQLFLALFPHRVQNTLRLAGLRDSFVIVDEPQVISADAWNLFLTVAEAATTELNTRFLFVTATMPKTEAGIFGTVTSLGRAEPVSTRYQVETGGPEDEHSLAGKVLHSFRAHRATAVILNTVRDAAEIYSNMHDEVEPGDVYFLSGRMTPLHKRERIEAIGCALKYGKGALVISTQVLEAGVDLSFKEIFRALPVIPSLVQAAGRCNRHGEGEEGHVYVFEFLRGGEKATRRYVYRNAEQREATDICLSDNATFDEALSRSLVSEYYHLCFQRNTRQTSLEKILAAAHGYLTAPAGLNPFGPQIPQYGVFVPLTFGTVPKEVEAAMDIFGCQSPSEIWDKYSARGFLSSLEYSVSKR